MEYKIYGLYDKDNLRYIGYTSKSLEERLRTHWQTRTKKGQQCHRISWLKSLKDKPVIKLIDKSDTLEEILQKEIFWIDFFRQQGKNLVNTCEGGIGSIGHKWSQEQLNERSLRIKQFDTQGNLIEVFSSISEAAERVTGNRKNNNKISCCCQGKYGRVTFKKFIWRYFEDSFDKYPTKPSWNVTEAQKLALSERQTTNNCMKGRIGKLHHNSVPVNKLDVNKNIIETFDSVTEAQKKTGAVTIAKAIKTNGRRVGFYWEYANKDIVQPS